MKNNYFTRLVYFIVIIFITFSCKKDANNNNNNNNNNNTNPVAGPDVTDFEGNVYHSVVIGTQTCMSKNLRVTHYRNGVSIPLVTINTEWDTIHFGAYCNYNHDTNNVATYGRLYNWYAVANNQNICPTGWHIPTEAEWVTLTNFLGGTGADSAIAGGKMKETGTSHWNTPNTSATNSSGYTGLPGGYRLYDGSFSGIGNNGYWWSATQEDFVYSWYLGLYYNSGYAGRSNLAKYSGFSVRCFKD